MPPLALSSPSQRKEARRIGALRERGTMKETGKSLLESITEFEKAHRWISYLLKSIVLIAALFLIAIFGPGLPPIVLAIVWAFASAVSAIGVAYHNVIKKVRRSFGLRPGGRLYTLNNGRLFALTFAFITSAICFGSLFLSLPKWKTEWALLFIAIGLFPLILKLAEKNLSVEYEPVLLTSISLKWSTIALTIVLGVLFIGSWLIVPVEPETGKTITEIFFSAEQPFIDSPSELISDLGCISTLIDSVRQFEEEYIFGLAVLEFIKGAAIAYSIASLIALCATQLSELKKVFLQLQVVRDIKPNRVSDSDNTELLAPIETISLRYKNKNAEKYSIANAKNVSIRKHKPLKRFAAWALILPTILIIACVWAGFEEAKITNSPLYSLAKDTIRTSLDISVFTLDGKTYDSERAKEIYFDAITEINAVKAKQSTELSALITEVYATYSMNSNDLVLHYYDNDHSFLDDPWINSASEKLKNQDARTVAEEDVRDQTYWILTDNVNCVPLNEQYESYRKELAELEATLKERYKDFNISESEIEKPREWIVSHVDSPINGLDATDFISGDSIIDAAFRVNGLPSDGADLYHDSNAVIDAVSQTQFSSETANKLERFFGSYQDLFNAADNPLAFLNNMKDKLRLNFEHNYLDITDTQKETYRRQIEEAINAQRDAELERVTELSPSEFTNNPIPIDAKNITESAIDYIEQQNTNP